MYSPFYHPHPNPTPTHPQPPFITIISGHYYYFYYPRTYDIYTLGFPNYQYICGLSFAYAVDGATTLLLRRWNFDDIDINTTTVAAATPLNATGPWQKAYNHITLPPVTKIIYPLYFMALAADMGEAMPTNQEMFLALDDINITFCLPCNFDHLSADGSIILTVPNVIPVLITALTNVVVVANSSICPNATFVYTIESGEIAQ